ncbi:MAG: MarR family transcriptional regulator [Planctomycetes bacterium]|nr:MarR family transcriptional regulator [Planctomycetota bacterium]
MPTISPSKRIGSWLPWDVVERVCKLNLKPASTWQVLLAVLLTSARYNGRTAHLGVTELVQLTGLSKRTVTRALALLINKGYLVRTVRYKRLQVNLDVDAKVTGSARLLAPRDSKFTSSPCANTMTPRKCQLVGPSPTCVIVSCIENSVCSDGTFTVKQKKLVADVLLEASELLGADVGELTLPPKYATRLDLSLNTTYQQAWIHINKCGGSKAARDFTGAVLALRADARVQGNELELL